MKALPLAACLSLALYVAMFVAPVLFVTLVVAGVVYLAVRPWGKGARQ